MAKYAIKSFLALRWVVKTDLCELKYLHKSLAKHKQRHETFQFRCNFYADCYKTNNKEKIERHNKKHIETWAKEPLKCANKDCHFGASSKQSLANHKKICDKRQIPDRQSVIVSNDRFQKEEIIHPSVIIRRKEYFPQYLQNFDDFPDFSGNPRYFYAAYVVLHIF